MTFDKKGEARKEYDRIRHQTATGEYVKPSKAAVDEIIDSYLKGATRGKRANTRRNYEDAFRCVRDQLGKRKAQKISKDDIEDLVDHMLTKGRKRGGKPGTGLSGRSVGQPHPGPATGGVRAGRDGRQARAQSGAARQAGRLPAGRTEDVDESAGPHVPQVHQGDPAGGRVAALAVRPAARGSARASLGGHRPEGDDDHDPAGAGAVRLQGHRRAAEVP